MWIRVKEIEKLRIILKKTAVAWLKAVNFEEANNLNPNELQEVALRKLGLAGDYKSVFGVVEIPWKKSL